MRTITLQIKDGIYEKVICFLKNLPKNEVKIIENDTKNIQKTFNSISLKTRGYKFNRDEANAR